MIFADFSNYLEQLEGVSSRLEITAILAKLFLELEIDEVTEAVYLLQGQLLPAYEKLEFQIAVKTVLKALAKVSKRQTDSLKQRIESEQPLVENLFGESVEDKEEGEVAKLYRELGDLGKVAEQVVQATVSQSEETIRSMYAKLSLLAHDGGADSQARKLAALTDILLSLDPISAKFVVRIILGRLRLGFSDMTIMDALSWAMTGGKNERPQLEEAYQRKTDVGKLATFYLQQKSPEARLLALQQYQVEVGVPVIPALCQRLNSAAEMIEKMTEVIAEPKYDGLRVQIHVQKSAKTDKEDAGSQSSMMTAGSSSADGGSNWIYKTFTRSLEENSHQFPELADAIETLDCESCILDAEAIGYDPETGELLPFQDTIQRKRKHGIAEKAAEVPIRFYVFDLLAVNGKDLLAEPLSERKRQLHLLFQDNKTLIHSPELRTSDPVVLHEYHELQLAEGLEGVVVKQLSAGYQSGRKGWSWVKMKEAEGTNGKLADTVDAVVMGYYMGRGKRAGFGIGAILVGIIDEKSEQILTLAKIGTGLTDDVLRQMKVRCDELASPTQPKEFQVHKLLAPDVWCSPSLVVEVAADEVTKSPLHSAGVALRFPRLVKFREDKTWRQATSLAEITQLSNLAMA